MTKLTKRELTSHHDGRINDKIKLTAVHSGPQEAPNRYLFDLDGKVGGSFDFQVGCLADGVGINGLTNEALLAIVADRLQCFQAGEFACEENAIAVYHTEAALKALIARTKERVKQNVADTYVNHKQGEGDKMQSRVEVKEDVVRIGDRTLSKVSLSSQWKAWQEAESAAKRLKPKLTEYEMTILSEIPNSVAASNGFNEFRQAVGQSG